MNRIKKTLQEELTELVDKYFPKTKPEGVNKGRGEAMVIVSIVLAKFESSLTQAVEEEVEKIKYHFETMVFDDTGEDKLINIMEFRKQQRKYLDDILSILKPKSKK